MNIVPFSSDEEVIAIARAFEAKTLPKEQWTHAAHFATALWLLRCRPDIRCNATHAGYDPRL